MGKQLQIAKASVLKLSLWYSALVNLTACQALNSVGDGLATLFPSSVILVKSKCYKSNLCLARATVLYVKRDSEYSIIRNVTEERSAWKVENWCADGSFVFIWRSFCSLLYSILDKSLSYFKSAWLPHNWKKLHYWRTAHCSRSFLSCLNMLC